MLLEELSGFGLTPNMLQLKVNSTGTSSHMQDSQYTAVPMVRAVQVKFRSADPNLDSRMQPFVVNRNKKYDCLRYC